MSNPGDPRGHDLTNPACGSTGPAPGSSGLERTVASDALDVTGVPGSAGGPITAPRPSESRVGCLAGEYRINAIIGEGGMGTVYAGVQEAIGKKVAIKVLKPDLSAHPDVMGRFLAEARAVNTIGHPNIVDIFSFGQFPDGAQYYVMEYLSGGSLSRRMTAGRPLSYAEALPIVTGILRAVGAAHERGIVHRDLKPDNVFLCDVTPPPPHVKLLDFGVAKFTEGGAATGQTGTGVPLGTPLYMSPEQCRGKDVDTRSDIYSLGVILYQMFTGSPPFVSDSFFELLNAHLWQEPPPPTRLARIPDELEGIILACLQKDKALRPGSIAELQGRLLPCLERLAADPAQAPPVAIAAAPPAASLPDSLAGGQRITVTDPTPRRPRRPSGWWVAASVAGVVAVGAWVWLGRERPVREPPPSAATGPRPSTGGPPPRSPELGLKALAMFHDPQGSAAAVQESSPYWTSVAEDFERAVHPGSPARWRAALHLARGLTLLHAGKIAEAETRLRQSVAIEPDWASAHVGLSIILARAGRTAEAVAAARRAQQLEPRWWVAVAASARAWSAGEKLEEAIQEYRRALQLAPREPILLSEASLVFHAAGLDSQAEQFARQALAADPDMVSALILLAERALEKSDGQAALEKASRALSVSPRSVAARLAQSDALALLGRKDDAREAYQRAVELWQTLATKGAPASRLTQVKASLARGELPPPRVEAARPVPAAPRGRPRSTAPSAEPPRPAMRPGRSRPSALEGLFD